MEAAALDLVGLVVAVAILLRSSSNSSSNSITMILIHHPQDHMLHTGLHQDLDPAAVICQMLDQPLEEQGGLMALPRHPQAVTRIRIIINSSITGARLEPIHMHSSSSSNNNTWDHVRLLNKVILHGIRRALPPMQVQVVLLLLDSTMVALDLAQAVDILHMATHPRLHNSRSICVVPHHSLPPTEGILSNRPQALNRLNITINSNHNIIDRSSSNHNHPTILLMASTRVCNTNHLHPINHNNNNKATEVDTLQVLHLLRLLHTAAIQLLQVSALVTRVLQLATVEEDLLRMPPLVDTTLQKRILMAAEIILTS
mmetsp:Transcript_5730/g.11728  ORF Transcript_5730/g.11728 Transcript_5730/m.11728 type:complete len:314 (-) Transcript_5730:2673-3614(-)